MTDLRAFIFIDQLQPQTLAYVSTWMRGSLPRAKMAAQIIEIAPGLDIEALTDVVLKSAEVRAGLLVVERQFGTLQFHAYSTAEVQAGAAPLPQTPGQKRAGSAALELLVREKASHQKQQLDGKAPQQPGHHFQFVAGDVGLDPAFPMSEGQQPVPGQNEAHREHAGGVEGWPATVHGRYPKASKASPQWLATC